MRSLIEYVEFSYGQGVASLPLSPHPVLSLSPSVSHRALNNGGEGEEDRLIDLGLAQGLL